MKVDLEFRLQKNTKLIQRIESRLRRLSTLRLLSFFSIPLGGILLYSFQVDIIHSLGLLIPVVGIFYIIVIRYNKISDYKERLLSCKKFLLRENQRSQKNTKSLFRSVPVSETIRFSHPYCEDLNLFEKDGLFSLIDTTATEQGEKIFLNHFLQLNNESTEVLLARQSRVKELSSNRWFSYKFLRKSSENWEFFLGRKWTTKGWIQPSNRFFENRKILKLIFPFYSILSCLVILSAVLFQSPFGAPLFLLNLILFILYRNDSVRELGKWKEVYDRLYETSRLVIFIKASLGKEGRSQVSKAFLSFDKAYSSIYLTGVVHFMANVLLLYDLWIMKRLSQWIEKNGDKMTEWIQELEEIDSLMPLLHLRFTNPNWVFPNISESCNSLQGENLAHPLLKNDHAIANPISRLEKGKVLLITGSNMAGKTTYMRTVGTNIILGLCGGPVHATSMEFPPLRITCSVKNQDSLTEGISLFYAEARRLSQIFESLNEEKTTYLILLDEILKGTNTKERFLASEKILTQLQGKNAFTLCTTHDLDLAKIPGIDLKHFTEKIEDNNMSFDYRIRDGVVETTNALFILKREGVIP